MWLFRLTQAGLFPRSLRNSVSALWRYLRRRIGAADAPFSRASYDLHIILWLQRLLCLSILKLLTTTDEFVLE